MKHFGIEKIQENRKGQIQVIKGLFGVKITYINIVVGFFFFSTKEKMKHLLFIIWL